MSLPTPASSRALQSTTASRRRNWTCLYDILLLALQTCAEHLSKYPDSIEIITANLLKMTETAPTPRLRFVFTNLVTLLHKFVTETRYVYYAALPHASLQYF